MKKIALVVMLLVLCVAANAATYYVSSTGNDSATGTITAPWKTVNYAWNHFQAGDTVLFRSGTYPVTAQMNGGPQGTSEAQRSTIAAYPGETVVWTGLGVDDQWIEFGGSYLTVKGITITNTGDYGCMIRNTSSHITLDSCIIHDVKNDGIKVHGNATSVAKYTTIQNCEFYGSFGGYNCIDTVGGRFLTIDNCRFHDIPGDAQILELKGGCQDVTVSNNIFTNCLNAFDKFTIVISVGGDTEAQYFLPGTTSEALRVIVFNNTIDGTSGAGIALWSAKDCKIYNNSFLNCAGRYAVWGAHQGTQNGFLCQNNQFYNNVISSVSGIYKALLIVDTASQEGSWDSHNNQWWVYDGTAVVNWGNDYSSYGNVIPWTTYLATGKDAGSILAPPGTTPVNHPPTAPIVTITPIIPQPGQSLVASATGSTDADGDAITYRYQWYKNDVIQTTQINNTIASNIVLAGEIWRCNVTAYDGKDSSIIVSAQVIVATTPPPVVTTLSFGAGTWNVTINSGTLYKSASKLTLSSDGYLSGTYSTNKSFNVLISKVTRIIRVS